MEIWIKYRNIENILAVPQDVSVAAAAEVEEIPIFGSCRGQGLCNGCSRRVRAGIENLKNLDGTPYEHPSGFAPFVQMCQVSVSTDGVSIDADSRARML
jgi:ferredoxin